MMMYVYAVGYLDVGCVFPPFLIVAQKGGGHFTSTVSVGIYTYVPTE